MTLYVAVLLLGQVAGDPQDGSPNVIATEPSVQFTDQGESPAATFGQPAPLRPSVEAAPLRPAAEPTQLRPSVQSAGPSRTTIRASARDEISPQVPAVEAQPPAEIAAPPARAESVAMTSQALQVAATMMQEMLVVDQPAQQNLRPIRLVEALSRIADPNLQSTAIQTYWDLAQAVAATRFSADKVRLLSEIPSPASETDRVLLTEALADAEAEEAATQNALLAAQFAVLQSSSVALPEAVLPWPADAPLVAPYRTRFETIFANQPAPFALRQIHHSLPGKLSLIEKRVSAMGAAESAADTLNETHKRGGVPLTAVLASIERLDQSRRAFVNAVIDYNHQIAQYSVSVLGAGIGSETLVTTLIKVPTANSSLVDIPSEVRQAGASAPAQGSVLRR